MKVALVHELLTMKGGAERVLQKMAEMFPDAPIYTLLYNEQKMKDWFPPERVQPSILQKKATSLWPLASGYNHHRYLRHFPRAVEAWDFSGYDLVISSSSAFTHNIITNGKPKHLSYIHSPARYLWDRTHDVQNSAGTGVLGSIKKRYFEHAAHTLRQWDAEHAPRADMLLSASKEVQRRIQLYWDRESTVLYPFLDENWLAGGVNRSVNEESPFLIVSTLAQYKRIDIAIKACNAAKLPLIIAGEGKDAHRLKSMAGPTIQFKGFQDIDALRELYRTSRALIFPGNEDFGITPLEAMSQGCPIIACKEGGALETVTEGKNGTFFEHCSEKELADTLLKFDHKKYSISDCRKIAEKFRESEFEQELRSKIDLLMHPQKTAK